MTINTFLTLGAVVAIQTLDPLMGSLVNFGALGIMVLWFMFRTEKKLERIEKALQTLSRAELISVLGRPGVEPSVKHEARKALREMGNGGDESELDLG